MTSKKNRRGKKSTPAHAEDDEMQLVEEANAGSPGAGRGASPAPSYDCSGSEDEDEPVNLMMIPKELKGVEKEVKEFRKDTKKQ